MDHLGEDHHVTRRLHDLVVAVVGGVHHRRPGAGHDEAAIVELIALRRIPTAPEPLRFFGACGQTLFPSSVIGGSLPFGGSTISEVRRVRASVD